MDPSEPHVSMSLLGLTRYLTELVRASEQPVRNVGDQKLFWLAELPSGVAMPEPKPDGRLLILDQEMPQSAPMPPALCADRIEGDLHDPATAVVLAPRTTVARHDDDLTSAPDPDPALRVFTDWYARWQRWAEGESSRRRREKLRKDLAGVARRLDLNGDALELVLAVGLLSWRSPQEDLVLRHLITMRAEASVDKKTGRVNVTLTDNAEPILEDCLFLREQDGFALSQTDPIHASLSEVVHPLDEQTIKLLRSWAAQALETPASFSEEWEHPQTGGSPTAQVSFAPALILRERGRNRLLEFYARIEQALSGPQPDVPLGWAQLLFPMSAEERLAWRATSSGGAVKPILKDEPLFPLPLNEGQRRVFEKLVKDTALVVEGPPGTGKTHTIANLLSALLAQGKRVLVTSMRDRALDVLFDDDMLPLPLQDLCVRMAHRRGPGRNELERTIERLSGAAAEQDVDEISRNIRALHERRDSLRREEAVLTRRIGELVAAETYDLEHMPSGYEGTRAGVAETVIQGENRYTWVGGAPRPGPSAPLTPAETWELGDLLITLSTDDQPSPSYPPVNPSAFPNPERFAKLTYSAARVLPDEEPAGRLAQVLSRLPDGELHPLLQELERVQSILSSLTGSDGRGTDNGWQHRALEDALDGQAQRWERLLELTRLAADSSKQLVRISAHRIQIPDVSSAEAARMAATAEAFRDYLKDGGRNKFLLKNKLQRDAEEDLYGCTIDDRPATTPAALDMIVTALRAASTLTVLKERWNAVNGPLPAEGMVGRQLEELCDRQSDLERVMLLAKAVDALRQRLARHHAPATQVSWPLLQQGLPLASLYRHRALALRELARLRDLLPDDRRSVPLQTLRMAIEQSDTAGYTHALEAVMAEEERYRKVRRCDELLAKVREVHPVLATQLEDHGHEPAWQERLHTLDDAWAWAIARDRLAATAQGNALQKAEAELDRVEIALQKTTADLAAEYAWRHCLTRMTPQQRSALRAFRNRMSELGKGTGRYSARHRRAAQDAISIAREAVPAWVMPLELVVETLEPLADSFDVVIVDESSQLPVEAVFLLWLAPHVIVVGDDKQCSPSMSRSGELQPIYDRIDEYLPDVTPAFRDEFSPKSNLYRLLNVRFPGSQRLTDHHRSMPEIISWSSREFYNDELTPVRQFGTDRLPPLVVEQVTDGCVEGRDDQRRNPPEAARMVSELKRMLADPVYTGKTFGLISLASRGQVALLEQLIDEEIPDQAEREARRLRVGTAPDFQGDQRDVILLSMVTAGRPPRAQGGQEWERQRWNVAATRARDQMLLFTSCSLEELGENDLRRSLLKHMLQPPKLEHTPAELANLNENDLHSSFDSLFEQRVFLRIRERGYHVIPSYPVGRKRIDLVVVGDHRRLAVECDGRYWHGGFEQIAADLARERVLRRAGWTFCRIREGDFILDQDAALLPLWERITQLGIHPEEGLR